MPAASRLSTRARRARARLLALLSPRPPYTDEEPEELLRLVEAGALHTAAGQVLRCLPVPPDLSKEARAGWRAARTAAVLALLAEAKQIAPPPPPPVPLSCRSRTVPAQEDDGPWTAWGMLDWSRDSAGTPSG
ncbi:hypothetical protein [Streptomyces sp. NPDC088757]|uniref:hypothetical protein n=1 Tax=Streptomyces sp. NPDC088757 TaxID=3365889 RepID=UPI00382A9F1A